MSLKTPSILKATGAIIQVKGSESGRGAFTAADLVGTKLLDALNLLRKDVGDAMVPLSTGETAPIYFEDVRVDATGAPFKLAHNLKRRVRWLIVDWVPSTTGQPPQVERSPDSTDLVLVLRSYRAGSITVRVW